jgi:putative hydrolase of the HAD superfamily
MIRALLFDLDRTLVDRDGSAEKFFAAQADRHLSAPMRAEFVTRLLLLDNHGYGDKKTMYRTLAGEFGIDPAIATIMEDEFRADFGEAMRPFADTLTVLARLHARGWPMGIVTNGTVRVQKSKITSTGMDVYMSVIVISEAEGIKKPAGEIFLRAAMRLGVAANEIAFVGDNLAADVEGSRMAGMVPVWFAAHDPEATFPGVKVRSLSELETWLVQSA